MRTDNNQREIELSVLENAEMCEEVSCLVLLPDIVFLLSAFVTTHSLNAREMLRCGLIDVLGGLLYKCSLQRRHSGLSCYTAVMIFPSLATLLVDRLQEFRLKSREYSELEAAVMSHLLFNIPLWVGGLSRGDGVVLAGLLIPKLSKLLDEGSENYGFVSVSDVVLVLNELTTVQVRVKIVVRFLLFPGKSHLICIFRATRSQINLGNFSGEMKAR